MSQAAQATSGTCLDCRCLSLPAASKRIEPCDDIYYRTDDDVVPTDDFLDGCPTKVSAQFAAVLDDVAEAPPPRYSGGGRREAMHGGRYTRDGY
jgi:hypothetical protein